MTNETTRRLTANILMSLVRGYYRDLSEYYSGDTGRFTRMVVDGGKQLPSASPQGWANHISNVAPDCLEYHADEIAGIAAQLRVWGLTVDETLLEVNHA